jgi:hypothetical protein
MDPILLGFLTWNNMKPPHTTQKMERNQITTLNIYKYCW